MVVGVGVVGKSDFKENPKSDLDLDLGFVNYKIQIKQNTSITKLKCKQNTY